jgi:hypothetical protein
MSTPQDRLQVAEKGVEPRARIAAQGLVERAVTGLATGHLRMPVHAICRERCRLEEVDPHQSRCQGHRGRRVDRAGGLHAQRPDLESNTALTRIRLVSDSRVEEVDAEDGDG